MLTEIHPKYTLSVHPKEGRPHNPVHDEVDGATATIIDLPVGKRGWIAYCFAPDDWHRLHTSDVENVAVDEYGNVTVTTHNTVYRLAKEMGLNAADLNGETFDVGDKVALISHGDSENIYYEPEIGTVGIVRDAGDVGCFVQWPDQSTEAGRDGNDDSWSVDNYKLKKIP